MWRKLQSILFLTIAVGIVESYTPPAAAVSRLGSYRSYSELTSAAGSMNIDQYTSNMTTWQMAHGGFYKDFSARYVQPWNGTEARSGQVRNGVELGTIDNNATIQEMRLLAVRYKATTNSTYRTQFRDSFRRAVNFIVNSQHASGSWPQMFPARGNYSDMATYNDNAMVRLMVLAKDVVDQVDPFDTDIATSAQRAQLQTALEKSVDFALRAQIVNNGVPTVWCAQHNPVNYAPVGARSYELASKSGSESAGVVWFLMNWPNQTIAVQNAVRGALAWYRRTRVADMRFSAGNFISAPGASMWYRFYEVNNDNFFFCDREGESTKTQDITRLSDDRRYGYQWAGDYGSALLNVESAYLSAIALLSSSSTRSSSSVQISSSSSMLLSSSLLLSSSSSVSIPMVAQCGSTVCSNVLQGENFCRVDGVTEDRNLGFLGTGYVNPNNAVGATVDYVLQAVSSASLNLFIRYANGTTGTRNARLRLGSQVVVSDLSFPTTGAWTNWQIIQVNIQVPTGRSPLIIEALTTDGLPNIDWLGWMGNNISIPACDAPTSLALQNFPWVPMQVKVGRSSVQIFGRFDANSQIYLRDFSGRRVASQISVKENFAFIEMVPAGLWVVEVHNPGRIYSRVVVIE